MCATPWWRALACVAVLGCGSQDAKGPAPCPTVALGELPLDRASAHATVELPQPTDALSTSDFAMDGPGTVASVDGVDRTWTVEIRGLRPGDQTTLRLIGDALASCTEAVSLDIEMTPEPFHHVGPVEPGDAAPATPPYFADISESAGFTSPLGDARAMLVDFDGDGRDDVVTTPVTTEPMRPRFFRNVGSPGNAAFTEVTADSGMAEAAASLIVFGDIDNDGDQDAFTGLSFRSRDGQRGIWLNDGSGRFTYSGTAGTADHYLGRSGNTDFYKEPAGAAFVDLNKDGNLDLYIGHWYAGSTHGNAAPVDDELYTGDGTGNLTPVELPDQHNPLTSESDPRLAGVARAAYGLSVGDFDNDGDADMFVNNYGAGRPALDSPPRYWDHNLLWRNDGELRFVDVGVERGVAATMRGTTVEEETPVVIGQRTYPSPIGGNGFGSQFGDIDNDGDLDLIVGTIAHPDYPQSDRTMLHINQGPPDYVFTEESRARGLLYAEDELHPMLVDIDNDGRLDLAMSRLRGGTKLEMYLQDTPNFFAIQTYEESGVDIARPGPTLWLDLDEDGDLDFFMPKGNGLVYENRAAENHWLAFRLEGAAPRDATGARVTIRTSSGLQMREVVSGNGHYNSQPSRTLSFGLGGDSGAESVEVRWSSGEVLKLGPVRADQLLQVTETGTVEVLRPSP